MASAASLSEPRVLTQTKRRLFPNLRGEKHVRCRGHAVCSRGGARWRANRPALRNELALFNRVQVGFGYPDLVDARTLGSEYLGVD